MTYNFTSVNGAGGVNWYVDSALGSDSNNGITPASAFATLQKAANSTNPGDTVFVQPGSGYGGGTGGVAPLIISKSGTAGKPITYTAITGTRPVISGTQDKGCISGTNPLSYVTINGFELAGWQAGLSWSGAVTNAGLSGTSWQSNVYSGYGIFFAGSTGSTNIIHHLTVTNCYIHDFPGNGIGINFGDYLTISNNIVSNCSFYSPYACSGISLYELHNIDSTTGTKNVVSGNIVSGCVNLVPNHTQIVTMTTNGTTSIGSPILNFSSTPGVSNYTMAAIDITHPTAIPQGAIISYYPSGTQTALQLNVVSPGVSSGDVIQFGYITDGEGIIIDDNTNAQSDAVAYVGRTLIINNTCYGNGSAGIQASPTTNNVDVIHNTCYQNQISFLLSSNAPSEIFDKTTNGSNFYNNTCIASTSVPSGWSQATGTTNWADNQFFGGNASHALPGTNNYVALFPQVSQSITATGQTIAVVASQNSSTVISTTTGASMTGMILAAGTVPGQMFTIINTTAFTIVFAASGTSHVFGTPTQAANVAQDYVWDGTNSLWRQKA